MTLKEVMTAILRYFTEIEILKANYVTSIEDRPTQFTNDVA